MITLHTLASGSSGNAALISWEGGRVLADAGISCKRIRERLRALDVQPEDLSGILITHTHGDHVSGLRQLLKWTSCPVWATARTGQELTAQTAGLESRLRGGPLCRAVDGGGFKLTAAPTSHDAPGSCGYRLDFPEGSVGLLTDTGVVTPEAEDILPGVALVMLEANHDVEMLREGPYSYPLKQRVLGPAGHLSNEAAGAFAVTLAKAGASSIVLAHLSAQNNAPALAWKAVRDALAEAGLEPRLSVAEPDKVCGPFAVQALVRGRGMERITVLCVGKLKERFYADAAAEYVKRLSRFCKLEIVELPEERLPDSPSQAQIDAALAKEAEAIRAKLRPGASLMALCVEGQLYSSEDLARRMAAWSSRGGKGLVFLIGGSHGLHPSIKAEAWARMSMSPMTFPHHLARVMLLEQIYRAYQINAGTKYHK